MDQKLGAQQIIIYTLKKKGNRQRQMDTLSDSMISEIILFELFILVYYYMKVKRKLLLLIFQE